MQIFSGYLTTPTPSTGGLKCYNQYSLPLEITNQHIVQQDAWQQLRSFTSARIALGRTGNSLPLSEILKMKMAHANARDAVYSQLQVSALQHELLKRFDDTVIVSSQASSRAEYLQRPDLGRRLSDDSVRRVQKHPVEPGGVCIILADGLSANAINKHAIPVLQHLQPMLGAAGLSLLPLCIASQARVALGDQLGELFSAAITVMLIGERPGLTSPESMSAYLTFQPKSGCTDEQRNCISNIRPEGLTYQPAAEKIFYLLMQCLQLQYSGVRLKDNQQLLPGGE